MDALAPSAGPQAGGLQPARDAAPPPLSADEFARFCSFFYRHTGIVFGEPKRAFVERRLQERIRATGADGFAQYFSLMRFQASGRELQLLVNAMTVNETYFFREDYQFQALTSAVLPFLARHRQRPIRIWSLPCATGEEPYSIAIAILEDWREADTHDVEIYASDIDSEVLEQARAGIYAPRALHRLSAPLRARYFAPLPDGRFRLDDGIRDSIDFSVVNVIDPRRMARFRGMDVVFCRNMLIYFDDLSRRQAVEAIYESLAPGGFVFLGHSESMSRMSSLFCPCRIGDSVVYQKPLDGE
jgi:chemotaxis protein methyltransferase CheR